MLLLCATDSVRTQKKKKKNAVSQLLGYGVTMSAQRDQFGNRCLGCSDSLRSRQNLWDAGVADAWTYLSFYCQFCCFLSEWQTNQDKVKWNLIHGYRLHYEISPVNHSSNVLCRLQMLKYFERLTANCRLPATLKSTHEVGVTGSNRWNSGIRSDEDNITLLFMNNNWTL